MATRGIDFAKLYGELMDLTTKEETFTPSFI